MRDKIDTVKFIAPPPADMEISEWDYCHQFAFHYARQQGWFADVESYLEIAESEMLGEAEFRKGLNLAEISCRFWRNIYT